MSTRSGRSTDQPRDALGRFVSPDTLGPAQKTVFDALLPVITSQVESARENLAKALLREDEAVSRHDVLSLIQDSVEKLREEFSITVEAKLNAVADTINARLDSILESNSGAIPAPIADVCVKADLDRTRREIDASVEIKISRESDRLLSDIDKKLSMIKREGLPSPDVKAEQDRPTPNKSERKSLEEAMAALQQPAHLARNPPKGTRHRVRYPRSQSGSESEGDTVAERLQRKIQLRLEKDDDDKVVNQWKLGPRQRGLVELEPNDVRFKHALSYRKYRLINTDPTIDADVTASTGLNARRLEHTLKNKRFDGTKPLEVLSFLSAFRNECNANQVSEGGALLLLPKFLEDVALETFVTNFESGDEMTDGFSSFPGAVNVLLETFARDRFIEEAIEEFDTLVQGSGESELAFSNRLRKKNRECGGVFTERELITRFQRGVREELRPYLTRDPHEPTIRSLKHAESLAAKVSASYRSLKKAMQIENAAARKTGAERTKTTIALVDQANLIGDDAPSSAPTASDDTQMYVEDEANAVERSQPYRPPYRRAQTGGAGRAPQGNAPPGFQQGVRPDTQHRPGNTGQQPRKDNLPGIPVVCYDCFLPGHYAPDCGLKEFLSTPSMAEAAASMLNTNFGRLPKDVQDTLVTKGHRPLNVDKVVEHQPQAQKN